MRHLLVFLVAAVGIVVASPLEVQTFKERLLLSEENTRNNALEEMVLALFEEIRELMLTGSDTIPVLDPLSIESIYVDQNTISLIPGHISIKDFVVKGLSTFEIHEFGIAMVSLLQQRYRMIMDSSIPAIDANSGSYDLDLSILGGSIFGTGDATLKIVRPRLRANMVMSIRLSGGIFLQLSEVDLRVSMEAFEPRITGLFNDPAISEFISLFLKNLVEELFQFFEEDINELLSYVVLEYGNEILANLDLGSIIGVQ